ncbi:type I restriction-modification system subunit M [Xanthomonas oryzae]|uniref:type I restriction-modification system subunit M n=1 Tax=Xanthomonas oryzae TaxID=347 RepID=UPI0023D952DA|nr:class I SAM-dependent DNA methyltransferase [Xanthomonas oryzae]MDI9072281.1 class I SAM-dependent DNA methyltransferase [Xanthomonas oryzae pv. oryzae]MDI9078100.1 class I SAM-dependent DNA methyltransferase [Xanthomonas oryzae pv. oryzae]MDI9105692.1 class I SAM-dependent DNA methyltransferase [Xanthomonas oryzae pv. oryzae]MDI9913242.1 class I SAM-dependent DNA methyltransferase [Xanthomonas oryzae pv. oryzae]WEK97365.1 type I restriction-modification system subunit M [Xanthomonas oryzae
MSISSTIKSIQDIMRKDSGVDGDAQRIGQLVWMLFLKILDDREQEWELIHEDYRSPLPQRLRWRNWAADPEGITGDELKNFIDIDLFPELRDLTPRHSKPLGFVVRDVFQDAYNYMKSGQLIRQVLNKIQSGVDFNKAQERHAFGDMYEQLLRDLQSAGNAGEFYTPRPVTEFMVRMVDPKLHEKVMDPACGTGGFLTCAIEHKRQRYVRTAEDEAVLQASIFGVEKKPLPHLLATTNMVLHGIEVPSQIKHDNTLARPLISWGPGERVDCIVANPPFGGMEEDGIESNFPAAFRTRETADLFLVLIMHLLKDGGRAAVVLPDGFLFGEGIKSRIKEKLLTECNLHTVVRLPNGVFNPYTGIKTNLLFFTKGTPTKDVWFYEHQYPAGYKSYSKSKPMRIEEFAVEEAWWGSEATGFAARQENAFAWKVSFEELQRRNWNLDSKNPHVGEQISHDPDELLRSYAALQGEIGELRDQLKAVLAEALERRV